MSFSRGDVALKSLDFHGTKVHDVVIKEHEKARCDVSAMFSCASSSVYNHLLLNMTVIKLILYSKQWRIHVNVAASDGDVIE